LPFLRWEGIFFFENKSVPEKEVTKSKGTIERMDNLGVASFWKLISDYSNG
jgi:hypothetical protein